MGRGRGRIRRGGFLTERCGTSERAGCRKRVCVLSGIDHSEPPTSSRPDRDERERLRLPVDRAEGDRQGLVPPDRLAACRTDHEDGHRLGRCSRRSFLLPSEPAYRDCPRVSCVVPGGARKRGMGWAGRSQPGLRGMEVGRAEPFSVLRVQSVQVPVQEGARGRRRIRDGTFSDEPGPRGFEPLTLRLRAACSTELSYGPATGRADPASTHKASLWSARRRFRASRPFSWARPATSVRVASVVLDVPPIDRTRRLRGPLRFPRFPPDRAPSRSVSERRGGCPRSTPTGSRGSAAPPP